MLNRMATDNLAKQLSCSFGCLPADPASDEPIFKELAAQAPRWAGFLALANQQAQGRPIGFLNPTLYALSQGANYHNDLHDVTSGNNFNSCHNGSNQIWAIN
jgi:hypothetical protein